MLPREYGSTSYHKYHGLFRPQAKPLLEKPLFSMAYGVEAMSPLEVGLPSFRRLHFNKKSNDKLKRCDLDFLNEMKNECQMKLVTNQRKMIHYYNVKVKRRSLQINDQVLWKVFLSSKESEVDLLGPNWEGTYRINEEQWRRTSEQKPWVGRHNLIHGT